MAIKIVFIFSLVFFLVTNIKVLSEWVKLRANSAISIVIRTNYTLKMTNWKEKYNYCQILVLFLECEGNGMRENILH